MKAYIITLSLIGSIAAPVYGGVASMTRFAHRTVQKAIFRSTYHRTLSTVQAPQARIPSWYRRVWPYAGVASAGTFLAYIESQKNNKEAIANASEQTSSYAYPGYQTRQATADKPALSKSEPTTPENLKQTYQTFQQHRSSTSYPKPLSGKFTTKFTGTYPDNGEIITADHHFTMLGLPVTNINKTHEKFTQSTNDQQITHTVWLSGHIQCNAGDTTCNNALYALSNTRDFTQCMHYALSHPEIPRTQRCQSLFTSLGKYGPGDHVLSNSLCTKAWWSFKVTLDD
jgi:hypothetical protein